MPAAQSVLHILRPLRVGGESYAACLRRIIDDVRRLDGALTEQQAAIGARDEEIRALREDCGLLRRERDAARRGVAKASEEVQRTSGALVEQVKITDRIDGERVAAVTAKLNALREVTELREAAKRQRIAHVAEMDARADSLLVGGLVGVVVGGVVTALLVAVM